MVKAKSKRKSEAQIDPRIRQVRSHVGIGWRVASVLAFVGSVLMIIGCATYSWVILEPMTYHYQTGFPVSRLQVRTYAEGNFGLYITSFNGGANVQPWATRVDAVCGGYAQLASQNAAGDLINLWQGSCSSNCVAHYHSRCAAYKELATLGFVVLAFTLGGACLSLTACLWLFVFGKSLQFLQFAWLGSGLVGGLVIGYWMMSANTAFNTLRLLSFYPAYAFGYSGAVALAGCGLNLVAGIFVCVMAWMDARKEWRIKQEKILQKEAELGDFTMPHMGGGAPLPGMSMMRNQPPPPRFGAPPPMPGALRR